MYKTAVYRLVNGGITHQKQQISEKSDDAAIHCLSVNVLLRNITFFRYLLFLMCNTAVIIETKLHTIYPKLYKPALENSKK